MAEKKTGKYVQCLRSNGGGEYFSNEFSNFLKNHEIQRQFSCRYTPQKNGVAERKIGILQKLCVLLWLKRISKPFFWTKVVSTAIYIMNKTSTVAIHDVTPKEHFTSKKPHLSHLKVFGCIAYVHVPDELHTKLNPKAKKCIFIGYSLE